MFFFIFASYNIIHWIHLLCRISVVLSSVTYRLFSRFYLMFVVTVFTATLVRILCGGIYRHFTTFYFIVAIRTAVRIETNCYTDFGPNRYILLCGLRNISQTV